ncbi:winged helix-turn-helix transcriptional regulator [Limimaricola pyoseonensis]|uniref:DNA-binding transcriptional regulator, HxlR family n=1 Tax=Limimaricola pyoseonensis TaxID=521013 RepID=A0A1G6ZYV7_9RHOB|nr:helix-turn-helix domain-containing protein [Limimaricola pyoseonensis]SDE07710.1 DNA-binding transcriptional regulator, HxlR family [Limimaricola pyoseonensis]
MSVVASYGQFCPVAMASELLCSRWTPLIVREFLCGSRRFNDLRRGLPRISPALLSKRLKELEGIGLIERVGECGSEYQLTPAGEATRPIIMALGFWAQSWVDSEVSLRNLDPTLLMWDMRRSLNVTEMPEDRRVIQFVYPDLAPNKQNHWLIVDGPLVDLCYVDPGFDIDLLVECALRTMTMIWMGLTSIEAEQRAGRLLIEGDRELSRSMRSWLGLSSFAGTPRRSFEAVRLAAAM